MKTISAVLCSFSLLVSTTAIAENYPPTKTYEATVNSVRMPDSSTGTITVKECKKCDYETYRVTERTVYALNGQSVRLDDFLLLIEELRASDGNHNINVRRDLETNTISKVFVSTK